MAIEKRLSSSQLCKRLKRLLKTMWARVRAKCSDILVAVCEMARRCEASARIQNVILELEERGKHNLIAVAYNEVEFV